MVKGRVERAIDKTAVVLNNKRTRSLFLLLISFIVILGVNSLLPLIEGQAHYTVEAVEMTHDEFIAARDEDKHVRLTWISEQKMKIYIDKYVTSHPELSPEEQMMVMVPGNFVVLAYSKFFFQYAFWYISTVISLGSTLILFYSLFNYLVTKNKDTYEKYVSLEHEITEMTNQNLDPVTFEPWMDNVFNKQRKINQHKSNVKYNIDSLEKKTSFKTRKKFKKYFEAVEYNLKSQVDFISDGANLMDANPANILKDLGELSKKENKYINKKETYLNYLDQNYIDKYVVNGKVKYFKYIHPMFVYNGVNGIGKTVDNYSLINSDAEAIASKAGSKIAYSLGITLLFAVLFTITMIGAYEQSPFWIIVNTIAKVAPLLIQIPMAIDYSNNFTTQHLIGNLINRRSIGLLYLADIKEEKWQEE